MSVITHPQGTPPLLPKWFHRTAIHTIVDERFSTKRLIHETISRRSSAEGH